MFSRKIPKCVGVAAVVSLSTPTVVGTIIKLLMNSGTIVKTAKEVKKGIDNAKALSLELAKQTSQNKQPSVNSETISEEVNSDMG